MAVFDFPFKVGNMVQEACRVPASLQNGDFRAVIQNIYFSHAPGNSGQFKPGGE